MQINSKFTDEQLIELLNQGITSHVELGRMLGVNECTIRKRRKRLALKGLSPEHDWKRMVPDGYKIRGVSTLYNSRGEVGAQWVKSAIDHERQLELIKEMVKGFTDDLPKIKTPEFELENNSDLLAVYPIGDPHIGMMSWGEETGDNWDLKIAEKVMTRTFQQLVDSVTVTDKAVLAFLGDNFHYDNLAGVTTRSNNVLDRDSRYGKMIRVGIRIVRQMIQIALSNHKIVTVIVSRGNHDDATSIFLREALAHIYENDERIIIDNSPGMFHYYKHGVNLLGFHHGDTCKMEKLPGVMACDRAKDWGDTKYRHWMTGHIHKGMVKDEQMGCVVESFNIMAPQDAYAYEGGWRSARNVQCLLYHPETGPTGRRIENL